MLRYRVHGCERLVVPGFMGRGRGDELWRTVCFELFLYEGEGCYREFNFSPSGKWAAYRFSGYRTGMADCELIRHPDILTEHGHSIFTLTAFIDARELAGAQAAAVSAVMEEEGGRMSYWALAHNPLKPDFHDPACFRIQLG